MKKSTEKAFNEAIEALKKKEEVTAKIAAIVNKHEGYITDCQMDSDCSITYDSIGDNVIALIEGFRAKECCEVVVYANENEVDNFTVEYKKLSIEILNEILEKLELYDEICEDMDRETGSAITSFLEKSDVPQN